MSIHINIDRLVLDGITISQRERPLLQVAVESELARLLAEGGLSRSLGSGGAYPTLAAAPIQLTSQHPTHLGQQIARAVYGGMRGETSNGR
jgi:hypothetical protein